MRIDPGFCKADELFGLATAEVVPCRLGNVRLAMRGHAGCSYGRRGNVEEGGRYPIMCRVCV